MPVRRAQGRPYPSAVIVGSGRVGGALARALRQARWTVRIAPRSLTGAFTADLVILAVPDAAIHSVATTVAPKLGPHASLVHCAGAFSLSVLETGNPSAQSRGSFHPLIAISSSRDSLADHSVAISANNRHLLSLLRRMARDLKLHPIAVPEKHRAAYHAGAVLSAGGTVALVSAATEALKQAGIAEPEALRALVPLMRSALDGLEARGLGGSLTGPVARGDVATVSAHLAALPPVLRELYRLLGLRSLALAEARNPPIPPRSARALSKALRP